MRRTHRSDMNRSALVDCARKLGMLVKDIGRPMDLLVGIKGLWFVAEIKAPRGTYTPAQVEFQTECAHHHLPLLTWRTEQDVIDCADGVAGVRGERNPVYHQNFTGRLG